MTRAEFREEVRAITAAASMPMIATHPAAGAGLDAFLLRALREFCAWSYALYSASVSFTLSAATREVSLAATTPRVFFPTGLVLGSTRLRDFEDRPGPILVREMELEPGGTGAPTRWALTAPGPSASLGRLWFNKAPANDTSGTVSGFVDHEPLENDGTLLQIADEWCRGAACYAASRLVEPAALGSALDKVKALDERAAREVVRLASLVKDRHPNAPIPVLAEAAAEARADD